MQGVLRTWMCLNRACAAEFDAWEACPACPACGCVRVNWKPGGGHVGTRGAGINAEFKMLADNYGLANLRRGDENTGAKIPHRPTSGHAEIVMQKTYGAGFSSPVYRSQQNPHGISTCLPSTSTVNLKGKVKVGRQLPRSGQAASRVSANTTVTSRWDGKP